MGDSLDDPLVATNEPDEEDTFEEDFRDKIRKVRLVALFTNGMYVVTSFLDFCSLTWATTVILGGDLESISSDDYAAVGLLLLLGALHFMAARFFGFIVMQKIISVTTPSDPDLLIDIDMSVINDDKKEYLLRLIGLAEQVFQVALILPLTVVLPVVNFSKLPQRYRASHSQNCPADPEAIDCPHFDAPFTSLKIFYALVLLNASLNIVTILLIKPVLLHWFVRRSTDLSLRRFYDRIIWTNLEHGFLQSWVDIDFVSFAFQVQADEYKRYQRALGVMKLYSDMMTYLYWNPRFKGFEKARELLESGDPYEREAAANIVGCWVKLIRKKDPTGKKLSTLRLQRKLMAKLADTMDHEETGRAATWSFAALAEANPEATARVKSEKGENLADILMDRIHEALEEDRPDGALVFIQVWIHLLPVINIDQPNPRYYTPSKVPTLQNDLLEIAKHPTALKRTQTVAAYALHFSQDKKYNCQRTIIHENLHRAPIFDRLQRRQKILVHEKNWLFEVLNISELPQEWNNSLEIIFDDPIPPTPNQSSNDNLSLRAFHLVKHILITFLKFSISPSIFVVSVVMFYKIAPPLILGLSHKLQMTSMALLDSTTSSL